MTLAYATPVSFVSAGPRFDRTSQTTVDDDWTNPVTRLADLSAGVAPASSDEPLQDGRSSVATALDLYFSEAFTVDRTWRARIAQGPYEGTWRVEGRPAVWESPFTGWQAGTVVRVELSDG